MYLGPLLEINGRISDQLNKMEDDVNSTISKVSSLVVASGTMRLSETFPFCFTFSGALRKLVEG